jgi:hypothetical protein
MGFDGNTKIGRLLSVPAARVVLLRHIGELQDGGANVNLVKGMSLQTLAGYVDGDWLEPLLADLAEVPEPSADEDAEAEASYDVAYEDDSVPAASAQLSSSPSAPRWGLFELRLGGPTHGNPFTDVRLDAVFKQHERAITVPGFYDGDGVYRVRFMPDCEGVWSYTTSSNARSLDGLNGAFSCTPAATGLHGPVRAADQYHFRYANGTRFRPIGTTCYAWVHQGNAREEQTLETLGGSPFNKIRMCIFPKSYPFNDNEPEFHPFEGSGPTDWDYTRPNPTFFRHLEMRIEQLAALGIEADLILFHPYDRWGYAEMAPRDDDRYLRYVTARLAAYANVWWSLANEWDLLWAKTVSDWERYARIIRENDPYRHLMSIHNGPDFYDNSQPWITHCSVQRIDEYRTAENTTDWREQWNKPIVIDECAYEGDIEWNWGNITGEELVRRFWEGTVRGGYVGHGETYVDPDDVLWWSKGGILHGSSPERIQFLRRILEDSGDDAFEPSSPDRGLTRAQAGDGAFYLYYLGFRQPRT